MARKTRCRMLCESISVSERVNGLSLKAALLYTWLIPHCDDEGRMSAKPKTIKARVVPMRDEIQEGNIKRLLAEMEREELVKVYGYPEGRTEVLQILDWREYQNLREPKASRYPPPPDLTEMVEGEKRNDTHVPRRSGDNRGYVSELITEVCSDLKISCAEFARIGGWRPRRVQRWARGEHEPRSVPREDIYRAIQKACQHSAHRKRARGKGRKKRSRP